MLHYFCFSTANLVLHQTVERIHVGKKFGDIPRGIFVVRGENVVLLGEVVSTCSFCPWKDVMTLCMKKQHFTKVTNHKSRHYSLKFHPVLFFPSRIWIKSVIRSSSEFPLRRSWRNSGQNSKPSKSRRD